MAWQLSHAQSWHRLWKSWSLPLTRPTTPGQTGSWVWSGGQEVCYLVWPHGLFLFPMEEEVGFGEAKTHAHPTCCVSLGSLDLHMCKMYTLCIFLVHQAVLFIFSNDYGEIENQIPICTDSRIMTSMKIWWNNNITLGLDSVNQDFIFWKVGNMWLRWHALAI